MQRAESYAALAPLLSAQLRRGVVTTCFLSAEDYQRELPRGLYYEVREGCLLLLRQRSGHFILNFYLQPGGAFFLPDVQRPIVTELSCRAKDADAMASASEQLQGLGFTECFRRLRRTRPAVEAPCTKETANVPFEAVQAFLYAQFDPLTGCIPPEDALRAATAAGETLCLTDEGGITGLLHYAPGRTACELRHLAVRADCRGHGLAQQLLTHMTARTGGQKCTVWARVGNTPAERFYEKNQFQPDGWSSAVLRLG